MQRRRRHQLASFALAAVASGMLPGCQRDALSGAPYDQALPQTADLSVSDRAIPDGALADYSPDAAGSIACGDASCASSEICIRGRCAGCCDLPPACIPIPSGCTDAPACGCFTHDPCGGCTTCGSVGADGIHCVNCSCQCAASWTPIATPEGPRAIATLRVGDFVYSMDRGRVAVVPILRVHQTAVSRHAVVRLLLGSGDTLEISGRHPTADQRMLDTLAPGDRLGQAVVVSVATVPYQEPFTYDILPASDSGTYFAAGALLGSTLQTPPR